MLDILSNMDPYQLMYLVQCLACKMVCDYCRCTGAITPAPPGYVSLTLFPSTQAPATSHICKSERCCGNPRVITSLSMALTPLEFCSGRDSKKYKDTIQLSIQNINTQYKYQYKI